jgi:predicted nucleic acid-binding protein
MKLLIDINVILDVVEEREPFKEDSGELLTRLEQGNPGDGPHGFIAGHTITTLYYLAARAKGRVVAAAAVADLLRIVQVVPLDMIDFTQALTLHAAGVKDFEDAVQVAAALKVGADALVTRDGRHYRAIPDLAILTPAEALRRLG